MKKIQTLTDQELLKRLDRTVVDSRKSLVWLLAYVGEVDGRRLFEPEGFPSLFAFVNKRLGFSEGETARRVHVARCGRRFPAVLKAIARGTISLTSASTLAPVISAENVDRLLSEAKGKTTREVQEIVARLDPKADRSPSLRKASRVKPSAPDRYHLSMTIDAEHRELLDRIQDLSGETDLAELHKKALALYASKLETKKYGAKKKESRTEPALEPKPERATSAPPSEPKSRKTRHVPRHAARDVYDRDEGRCTYRNHRGERCLATRYLQLDHHRTPFARGGEHSPDNLTLRCATHNRMTARQFFGERFGAKKLEQTMTG